MATHDDGKREARRPTDALQHQFVPEDRQRMDYLSAKLQALTAQINDLALDLRAYMDEWRAHR